MYINALCKISEGELLLLWSDDAFIETPHWDTIMKKLYKGEKYIIYQFPNNHYPNFFPLISRAIYEKLGHFSLNAHNDTWVERIGKECGIMDQGPDVHMFHNLRSKDTENSMYDDVNIDCRTTSPEFYSREVQLLLTEDIEKIKKLIEFEFSK